MEMTLNIPRNFSIIKILSLIKKIDLYIIDYELDVRNCKINILTLPDNQKYIKETFESTFGIKNV